MLQDVHVYAKGCGQTKTILWYLLDYYIYYIKYVLQKQNENEKKETKNREK